MFWAHFGLLQQFPHVGLFRWPFWIQVASTEKSPKRFGQSSSIFKRDKQKFWILKSSHVEFSLSAWQKPWKLQAFIHFTLYEISRINGLTTVQLTPSVVSRWSHDPTLRRSYSDQSLSFDEKSSDLSEKAHFAAMGQNGKKSDSVEAFSANWSRQWGGHPIIAFFVSDFQSEPNFRGRSSTTVGRWQSIRSASIQQLSLWDSLVWDLSNTQTPSQLTCILHPFLQMRGCEKERWPYSKRLVEPSKCLCGCECQNSLGTSPECCRNGPCDIGYCAASLAGNGGVSHATGAMAPFGWGWMELDVLRIHGEHIGSIATVRIGDWMLCLMPLVTVIFKLSPA